MDLSTLSDLVKHQLHHSLVLGRILMYSSTPSNHLMLPSQMNNHQFMDFNRNITQHSLSQVQLRILRLMGTCIRLVTRMTLLNISEWDTIMVTPMLRHSSNDQIMSNRPPIIRTEPSSETVSVNCKYCDSISSVY